MAEEIQQFLEKRKSNRRDFVQKLGVAGVAAGVVSSLAPSLQADPTAPTDTDILNFALNLEFLEAEFYTMATTGMTIAQLGIIDYGTGTTGGATTGGAQVTFTDNYTRHIAEELAQDERMHVALLQNALAGLGNGSAAKPAINLNALGFGFGSQVEFLRLARIFEDIGVTAYGGAAGLISSKAVLGSAARILAVEAEHVGAIRLLMAQQSITTPALDGADVLPPPSGVQFFSTDSNALTQTRTPGQVLYLAYGNQANATKGGFFPAGVNGNLVTSAAAAAGTDSASLTASPNPVPANGATYVATTLTWSAPGATTVEVHVGSPSGALFAQSGSTGTMATGTWVTNGMIFYLQDVSGGKALIPQNTLATLIINFQ